MTTTITEALAELKTIEKRLVKKRDFVINYLTRQDGLRDPFEKDGLTSVEAIRRERQGIADLTKRHVAIRTRIQAKNLVETLTISDVTQTIAEWLNWRKEVAPGVQAFQSKMRTNLDNMRRAAQQKGFSVVGLGAVADKPSDLIVNIDEADLAREAEFVETVLGTLDGLLSLRNATLTIELPE